MCLGGSAFDGANLAIGDVTLLIKQTPPQQPDNDEKAADKRHAPGDKKAEAAAAEGEEGEGEGDEQELTTWVNMDRVIAGAGR